MNRRIGIDARLLTQTGVGVYTRNLLEELGTLADPSLSFYIYIRAEDAAELPSLPANFIIRTVNAQWHSFTEQTLFLAQLSRDNLSLMHFCYFSFPILYNRPFVITIHDLIPFKYPTGKASTRLPVFYRIKHFFYKKVLIQGLSHAKKVFVPSNAVKNDIKKYFPTLISAHIVLTYEGLDRRLQNIVPKPLPVVFKKPYFLYVGNYYPHKNVFFLLNAFKDAQIDAQLVLCGPSDYFASRVDRFLHTHNIEDKVIRVAGISVEERAYLYAHAQALVHPSKEEGFGLPLVEAAHFACPVIAADIPVFREIMPKAHFFSLDSNDSLKKILKEFANRKDKDKIAPLDDKFSFTNMAKETYTHYLECL